MNTMLVDIQRLLVRELGTFAKEIEMFPDDVMLWQTVPGVTNSAGNLGLHICGNLKYFIGTVLGGTGFVRNRELEFSTRAGTRADLARQINETSAVISKVMPGISDATLAADFPEPVAGFVIPCGRFLLHLSAHAAFHLGQVGYIRRVLTGENLSAGPVPLPALAK